MRKLMACILMICMVSNSSLGVHAQEQILNPAENLTSELSLDFISNPKDYTGKVGETAVFEVSAVGEDIQYQWQLNSTGTWKNTGLTGCKTEKLEVPILASRNGYQYRCIITDKSGKQIVSESARLIVGSSFKIISNPKDYMGYSGQDATFTVKAEGDGLTYQWQCNGSGVWKNSGSDGYNTDTLTIPIITSRNGYQYRCIVRDKNGAEIISEPATLLAKASIDIIRQPEDYTGEVGKTAVFEVEAEGDGITYQWQLNSTGTWKNTGLTGCKTERLEVPILASRNGYQYRCVITNKSGKKLTTKTVVLYVVGLLEIVSQPSNYTGIVGETAVFKVAAKGNSLQYQWQLNSTGTWKNTGLTGCKTEKLEVPILASRNGYQYRCIITDKSGKQIVSESARLIVGSSFKIISNPKDYMGYSGQDATFTVKAEGDGLTYQWQCNGSGVWKNSGSDGYNTDTLTIPIITSRNGYQYRCIVRDKNGAEIISEPATLLAKASIDIIRQPEDYTGEVGKTAVFEVEAEGDGITYQWQLNSTGTWKNTGLTGCKTERLEVPILASRNGYQYRCVITNKSGKKLISEVALLVVKKEVTIIVQPVSRITAFATPASFSLMATGSDLTYTWYINNVIVGRTSSITLTRDILCDLINLDDAFLNGTSVDLYCMVSDGTNTVTSDTATLTINPCEHEKIYKADTENAHTVSCITCAYSTTQPCNNDKVEHTNRNEHTYYCSECGQAQKTESCYDEDEDGICDVCGTELFIPLEITETSDISSSPALQPVTLYVKTNKSATVTWYQEVWNDSISDNEFTEIGTGESIEFTPERPQWYEIKAVVTTEDDEKEECRLGFRATGNPVDVREGLIDCEVMSGEEFSFEVNAVGDGLTYQWYKVTWTDEGELESSEMIEGATDSHYSGIAEVTDDDLWQSYMVVVTDRYKNESRPDATVHIHPELKITEQLPETLEAYDGDWEDLHVEAGGYNLRYRWQLSKDGGENWTNISGATGSYYHFRTHYDGYQYRCRVTDGLGHKIYSNVTTLTVYPGLEIISTPEDVVAAVGSEVTFAVEASGIGLTYQWYLYNEENEGKGELIDGATEAVLTVTAENSGSYECQISDSKGNEERVYAHLNIVNGVVITQQPQDVTCGRNERVELSAIANGMDLTFHWKISRDGGATWNYTTLNGNRTECLNFRMLKNYDGVQFCCEIKDGVGNVVTTDVATVFLQKELEIITQPENYEVPEETDVVLSVEATGDELTYQWCKVISNENEHNYVEIEGATENTLTVNTQIPEGDESTDSLYVCIVKDAYENQCETQWSDVFVYRKLAITAQPQDVSALAGDVAELHVEAQGVNLRYRWQVYDSNSDTWKYTSVNGYVSDTLQVWMTEYRDGNSFRCVVSDGFGNSAISEEARVSIMECPHSERRAEYTGDGKHNYICEKCGEIVDSASCYDEDVNGYCDVCGAEIVKDDSCGENLKWSFDSSTGVLSISGSGAMTNFDSIEDAPWFPFKDSILSIQFNGENIEIGSHAFEGLNISSIDLSNVTVIGDCAFKNCENIQGLVDGSNLTWIGEGSFENCSNITSIYIGSNITYIGDFSIKNCSNLTSIVVAENTKFEGNITLDGVNDEITVVIGNNVYIPIGDNDTPTTGNATVIKFSKNENGEIEIKKDGEPDVLPPMGVSAERAEISGENTVEEGKRVTLHGEIYPKNAVNRGFTWTISDETVAVVDTVSEDTKTVTISGIKAGEVTVKAVNKNNGVSAEFAITVTCAHDWSEGICSKCGEVCKHEWKDGICVICKKICSHKWANGRCEICDLECDHKFADGKCSVCGYECTEHNWSDGTCTVCGKICEHEKFENGVCVVCGMTEPTTECKHDWSNNDGVCTICGERCTHNEASYCQEARFDYESDSYECKFIVQHNLYCSICNINITEKCNDGDSDGKCDICGECMHTNLQKEQMDGYMHNITCLDCNKEISSCEPCHDMNGDSLCDICGNWIAGSAGPGMNECTCGCGLTGCTCGPECPTCGNMSTSSANDNMQETTEKEFSEGADAETLFSDGQGMESLDVP